MNVEELDRIIDAAMQAPLNEADGQKLKTACMRWWKDWRGGETRRRPTPCWNRKTTRRGNCTPEPEQTAPAGHGRNAASAFTGAETVSVQHAQLKPGDPCPECREGKVYRQKEPKTLIRIVGQAPLKATVFEMERLRCNGCCQVFTASEPSRRVRKSSTPPPWR